MQLDMPDAEFYLIHLDYDVDTFFNLRNNIEWKQDKMRFTDGSSISLPRLTAWFGKTYNYSGITNKEQPIPDILEDIKKAIEKQTNHTFNSVLLNLYRDGNDSVGMHSDDEKELGKNPFIASLSLGQTRTFQIKHNITYEQTNIELHHGDLLIMGHNSQLMYKHGIPKERKYKGERINLTFRTIN